MTIMQAIGLALASAGYAAVDSAWERNHADPDGCGDTLALALEVWDLEDGGEAMILCDQLRRTSPEVQQMFHYRSGPATMEDLCSGSEGHGPDGPYYTADGREEWIF